MPLGAGLEGAHSGAHRHEDRGSHGRRVQESADDRSGECVQRVRVCRCGGLAPGVQEARADHDHRRQARKGFQGRRRQDGPGDHIEDPSEGQ
ncbi:hypothetical protein JS82_00970 [Methanomassiliicoccaceae archaeon DOK]|nr:hypothetical protein JS82_00970 [Methanomassiliicoccaceae archaeon DOK]